MPSVFPAFLLHSMPTKKHANATNFIAISFFLKVSPLFAAATNFMA